MPKGREREGGGKGGGGKSSALCAQSAVVRFCDKKGKGHLAAEGRDPALHHRVESKSVSEGRRKRKKENRGHFPIFSL